MNQLNQTLCSLQVAKRGTLWKLHSPLVVEMQCSQHVVFFEWQEATVQV